MPELLRAMEWRMDDNELGATGPWPSVPLSGTLGGTSYARVRDVIRTDIVNGVLEAGARLKTAELAERYGVSQVPVREALQQLQGEGLVEIEPNRGARVRRIDLKFITNVFEIREAVAGMLAAKAAGLMTDAAIAELEAHQADFAAAIERDDMPAILQRNNLFHRVHTRVADNREAEALLDRHFALIWTLRQRLGFSAARKARMCEEHELLIDAFRRRDPVAAQQLTQLHTRHAMEDMLEQASGRL